MLFALQPHTSYEKSVHFFVFRNALKKIKATCNIFSLSFVSCVQVYVPAQKDILKLRMDKGENKNENNETMDAFSF